MNIWSRDSISKSMSIGEKLQEKFDDVAFGDDWQNKEIWNIVFKKSKREREREFYETLSFDDRKSSRKQIEWNFKNNFQPFVCAPSTLLQKIKFNLKYKESIVLLFGKTWISINFKIDKMLELLWISSTEMFLLF